jgi:hypothetical protein
VSPNHLWITRDDVERLHAAKLRVVPWTANEEADWRRLLALGVDGIITDDPEGLLAWLRANGRSQRPAALDDAVATLAGVLATPPAPHDLGGITEVAAAAAEAGFGVSGPFAGRFSSSEVADAIRRRAALVSHDGALVAMTVAQEPLSAAPCSYESKRSVILHRRDLTTAADTLVGAPFEVVGFTKSGVRIRVYGERCRPTTVTELMEVRTLPARDLSASPGRGVFWRVDAVVSRDGKRLLAVDRPKRIGNQCVEEPAVFARCAP